MLTDAIFSIFTIVFLSWLFNLREKPEWNKMKDVAKAIGWFLEHTDEEEE